MKNQIILILTAFIFITSCNSQQNVDAIGMEGVSLFESGDIQGALKKFNQIIEIDDSNSEAYLRKADCLEFIR